MNDSTTDPTPTPRRRALKGNAKMSDTMLLKLQRAVKARMKQTGERQHVSEWTIAREHGYAGWHLVMRAAGRGTDDTPSTGSTPTPCN